MSKRLRDGVVRFSLQIHSRWMIKTCWRAQSQRSHSGGLTPRTKQEDSGQESLRMDIQKHCIRQRPKSSRMPHATAQHWTTYYSVIQHLHVYIQYTEATVLSTTLTRPVAVSPMSSENVFFPSNSKLCRCHNVYCTLYFCQVLCYVFVLCWHLV